MLKRLLQIAVLGVTCFVMLGAGAPSVRFDALGHMLVCQCGCGQILLECNHVGCPVSPVMIDELHTEIATGLPDAGVLNWFSNKYGPVVLAAPLRKGFDLVAWIVPFAVLLVGIGIVVLVISLWRKRSLREAAAAGLPVDSTDPALRERIRRETEYDSR